MRLVRHFQKVFHRQLVLEHCLVVNIYHLGVNAARVCHINVTLQLGYHPFRECEGLAFVHDPLNFCLPFEGLAHLDVVVEDKVERDAHNHQGTKGYHNRSILHEDLIVIVVDHPSSKRTAGEEGKEF